MSEVEIKFEREGRDGVIAVGTYLIDAAKRFGIAFDGDCIQNRGVHYCALMVSSGAPNLSPLTTAETEHFEANGRKVNERLACQTKIETPGEIVVMTNKKKENTPAEDNSEQYKKEFSELPLEKKIATLVRLEAIALGETFSFIIDSPFKVFDKLMDVMAEFGLKKEQNDKNSARPTEHGASTAEHAAESEHTPKGAARKRSGKPKTNE